MAKYSYKNWKYKEIFTLYRERDILCEGQSKLENSKNLLFPVFVTV